MIVQFLRTTFILLFLCFGVFSDTISPPNGTVVTLAFSGPEFGENKLIELPAIPNHTSKITIDVLELIEVDICAGFISTPTGPACTLTLGVIAAPLHRHLPSSATHLLLRPQSLTAPLLSVSLRVWTSLPAYTHVPAPAAAHAVFDFVRCEVASSGTRGITVVTRGGSVGIVLHTLTPTATNPLPTPAPAAVAGEAGAATYTWKFADYPQIQGMMLLEIESAVEGATVEVQFAPLVVVDGADSDAGYFVNYSMYDYERCQTTFVLPSTTAAPAPGYQGIVAAAPRTAPATTATPMANVPYLGVRRLGAPVVIFAEDGELSDAPYAPDHLAVQGHQTYARPAAGLAVGVAPAATRPSTSAPVAFAFNFYLSSLNAALVDSTGQASNFTLMETTPQILFVPLTNISVPTGALYIEHGFLAISDSFFNTKMGIECSLSRTGSPHVPPPTSSAAWLYATSTTAASHGKVLNHNAAIAAPSRRGFGLNALCWVALTGEPDIGAVTYSTTVQFRAAPIVVVSPGVTIEVVATTAAHYYVHVPPSPSSNATTMQLLLRVNPGSHPVTAVVYTDTRPMPSKGVHLHASTFSTPTSVVKIEHPYDPTRDYYYTIDLTEIVDGVSIDALLRVELDPAPEMQDGVPETVAFTQSVKQIERALDLTSFGVTTLPANAGVMLSVSDWGDCTDPNDEIEATLYTEGVTLAAYTLLQPSPVWWAAGELPGRQTTHVYLRLRRLTATCTNINVNVTMFLANDLDLTDHVLTLHPNSYREQYAIIHRDDDHLYNLGFEIDGQASVVPSIVTLGNERVYQELTDNMGYQVTLHNTNSYWMLLRMRPTRPAPPTDTSTSVVATLSAVPRLSLGSDAVLTVPLTKDTSVRSVYVIDTPDTLSKRHLRASFRLSSFTGNATKADVTLCVSTTVSVPADVSQCLAHGKATYLRRGVMPPVLMLRTSDFVMPGLRVYAHIKYEANDDANLVVIMRPELPEFGGMVDTYDQLKDKPHLNVALHDCTLMEFSISKDTPYHAPNTTELYRGTPSSTSTNGVIRSDVWPTPTEPASQDFAMPVLGGHSVAFVGLQSTTPRQYMFSVQYSVDIGGIIVFEGDSYNQMMSPSALIAQEHISKLTTYGGWITLEFCLRTSPQTVATTVDLNVEMHPHMQRMLPATTTDGLVRLGNTQLQYITEERAPAFAVSQCNGTLRRLTASLGATANDPRSPAWSLGAAAEVVVKTSQVLQAEGYDISRSANQPVVITDDSTYGGDDGAVIHIRRSVDVPAIEASGPVVLSKTRTHTLNIDFPKPVRRHDLSSDNTIFFALFLRTGGDVPACSLAWQDRISPWMVGTDLVYNDFYRLTVPSDVIEALHRAGVDSTQRLLLVATSHKEYAVLGQIKLPEVTQNYPLATYVIVTVVVLVFVALGAIVGSLWILVRKTGERREKLFGYTTIADSEDPILDSVSN